MSFLEIHVDGACSGNPGQAGIGVVVKEDGKVVSSLSQFIGEGTNNIAEYTALIYALQEALILKTERAVIYTDSELLYHQMNGHYKVKHAGLKPLFYQIQHLLKGFKKVTFVKVPREKNKEADNLATQAIKREQAKVVASASPQKRKLKPKSEDEGFDLFGVGEESPSSKG